MEKQSLTFSFSKFVDTLRAHGGAGMDVAVVWRFFLSLLLCSVIGVGLFAYLTYNWAITDDASALPSTRTRDTQTISELKGVITTYQQKEKDYLYLMATEPTAPAFMRGVGPSAPSTINFEAEIALPVASSSEASVVPTLTTTSPRIVD